jgi:hypothetical protein
MPTTYGQLTDSSGTLIAGGTAQTPLAANASRRYLLIVNQSAHVIWVDFGQTATAASIPLAACGTAGDGTGGSLEFKGDGLGFVPTGAVSVYGATTGSAFTLKSG